MSDPHEVPGKNRVHCRLEEKSLTAAENKALQIFFPYIVCVVSDENHLDL